MPLRRPPPPPAPGPAPVSPPPHPPRQSSPASASPDRRSTPPPLVKSSSTTSSESLTSLAPITPTSLTAPLNYLTLHDDRGDQRGHRDFKPAHTPPQTLQNRLQKKRRTSEPFSLHRGRTGQQEEDSTELNGWVDLGHLLLDDYPVHDIHPSASAYDVPHHLRSPLLRTSTPNSVHDDVDGNATVKPPILMHYEETAASSSMPASRPSPSRHASTSKRSPHPTSPRTRRPTLTDTFFVNFEPPTPDPSLSRASSPLLLPLDKENTTQLSASLAPQAMHSSSFALDSPPVLKLRPLPSFPAGSSVMGPSNPIGSSSHRFPAPADVYSAAVPILAPIARRAGDRSSLSMHNQDSRMMPPPPPITVARSYPQQRPISPASSAASSFGSRSRFDDWAERSSTDWRTSVPAAVAAALSPSSFPASTRFTPQSLLPPNSRPSAVASSANPRDEIMHPMPRPPPEPPRVLTPPPPSQFSSSLRAAHDAFLCHKPPPPEMWVAVETSEDAYRLVVNLPGIDRGAVTLSARRRRVLQVSANDWRVGGLFERRIKFGHDAELNRVQAEFDEDMLRVVVPRKASPEA